MAHQEDRALIAVQHLEEDVERVGIEIVGRLVEHEQVRRLGEDLREQQPVALAA